LGYGSLDKREKEILEYVICLSFVINLGTYKLINKIAMITKNFSSRARISSQDCNSVSTIELLDMANDTDQHLYTYDDIYQVTDVNYPTSYENWKIYDTTFNYDDAGNRTSVIDGGTTTYTTNQLNQYSSVGNTWYEYDNNGNLTYDGTCLYDYDAENRLTEATNDSGAFNGPLNKALDCFDFEFTTGGSGSWSLTTSEYCDDPNHDNDRDSAECDQIPVWQSSSVETTVYGYGKISFCWKAEGGTRLSFSVDGSPSSQPGTGSWQEELNYNITGLGLHTVKWTFYKEEGASAEDKFWLDNVRWISNNPSPSTELQEALDTDLPVITDGDMDGSPRHGRLMMVMMRP